MEQTIGEETKKFMDNNDNRRKNRKNRQSKNLNFETNHRTYRKKQLQRSKSKSSR